MSDSDKTVQRSEVQLRHAANKAVSAAAGVRWWNPDALQRVLKPLDDRSNPFIVSALHVRWAYRSRIAETLDDFGILDKPRRLPSAVSPVVRAPYGPLNGPAARPYEPAQKPGDWSYETDLEQISARVNFDISRETVRHFVELVDQYVRYVAEVALSENEGVEPDSRAVDRLTRLLVADNPEIERVLAYDQTMRDTFAWVLAREPKHLAAVEMLGPRTAAVLANSPAFELTQDARSVRL